jgi:hypothetical protein
MLGEIHRFEVGNLNNTAVNMLIGNHALKAVKQGMVTISAFALFITPQLLFLPWCTSWMSPRHY